MSAEREPIFNAGQPWPPLLLAGMIVAGYAVQALTGQDVSPYVFAPTDLMDGRWVVTLLSSMFVHGSWPHALLNAVFCVAFGAPLARYLTTRPGGAGVFVLFYLACGAAAGLGFAAVRWGQDVQMAGASGAISGLAAVAARLIAGRGEMGKILSPPVIGMGGAWLIINLLTAIFGFAPGAGGMPVAWEAHLAGFAAGLVFSCFLPMLRPPDLDPRG